MLADVVHAIGFCFFCVGKLVNPDRLGHCDTSEGQSPLWHTLWGANTCPEGQMCAVDNQARHLISHRAFMGARITLRRQEGMVSIRAGQRCDSLWVLPPN